MGQIEKGIVNSSLTAREQEGDWRKMGREGQARGKGMRRHKVIMG